MSLKEGKRRKTDKENIKYERDTDKETKVRCVTNFRNREREWETDWTKPLTAPSIHRLIQQGDDCKGCSGHQGQILVQTVPSAGNNADVFMQCSVIRCFPKCDEHLLN